MATAITHETQDPDAIATAKQQIIELRMRYAQATDQIGSGGAEGLAQGRATYREIYTKDATIGADGIDPVTGPDAWTCLLYTSPSPRDATLSRMPSSA